MTAVAAAPRESYGRAGVTLVDRFGVFLSQRAIRRCLPPGDSLHVVELGCGYRAKLLAGLQDRVGSGIGVDFQIDPQLRSLPGFTFIEGSIESALPALAQRAADVVLMISVLEHLRDPRASLAGAHCLLKPGGRLLINVPTWRGKTFLEFSAFRLGTSPALEMDDHKMYYDKRDLWPLLVEAGFQPSRLSLRYHKFGLNLFAIAHRGTDNC